MDGGPPYRSGLTQSVRRSAGHLISNMSLAINVSAGPPIANETGGWANTHCRQQQQQMIIFRESYHQGCTVTFRRQCVIS